MSRIQNMILNNPKLAISFMSKMPPSFWWNKAERGILELFHNAAVNVPAYRQFLYDNSVDHSRIKTIDDFREQVPISTKENYLNKHGLDELVFGRLNQAHTFYMSGGTTGDSSIFAVGRETLRAYPPAMAAIFNMYWNICNPSTSVLLVNAMSLGAWMAGLTGSAVFKDISDKYPNISFIAPGADAERIIDMFEAIGNIYDVIVLTTYPTFLKEIIYVGQKRGINWPKLNLKLVIAGEHFDYGFRQHLVELLSPELDRRIILEQYGGTEIGNPGAETPLAGMVRHIASNNEDFAKAIFSTSELGTVLQGNPLGSYVEVIDGSLVVTKSGMIPSIRYKPKDSGNLYHYEDMLLLAKEFGIDLIQALREDGWDGPIFKWPFLVLKGRTDYAISIYGAKIAPMSMQELFIDEPKVCNFKLRVNNREEHSQFEVYLELQRGVEVTSAERSRMSDFYSKLILGHLLKINFDFEDAYAMHPASLNPSVTICDYHTSVFESDANSFKAKNIVP